MLNKMSDFELGATIYKARQAEEDQICFSPASILNECRNSLQSTIAYERSNIERVSR